jgi:hypothetical protein
MHRPCKGAWGKGDLKWITPPVATEVPISNTGRAIMLAQNDPAPAQMAAE